MIKCKRLVMILMAPIFMVVCWLGCLCARRKQPSLKVYWADANWGGAAVFANSEGEALEKISSHLGEYVMDKQQLHQSPITSGLMLFFDKRRN